MAVTIRRSANGVPVIDVSGDDAAGLQAAVEDPENRGAVINLAEVATLSDEGAAEFATFVYNPLFEVAMCNLQAAALQVLLATYDRTYLSRSPTFEQRIGRSQVSGESGAPLGSAVTGVIASALPPWRECDPLLDSRQRATAGPVTRRF